MPDTKIIYRRATIADLDNIQIFVDYWLSGRALRDNKNGGNDYFVSKGQHKSYLKNSHVLIAVEEGKIVGWAVKGRNDVMIHLLIAGDCRGKGVGTELLKRLNPSVIRSKSDQQTGDPFSFYKKHGYKRASSVKVGKNDNIELLSK